MKINQVCGVAVLLLVSGVPSAFAEAVPNTIYGTDSRKDLYEISDANTLRLADSTVALIDQKDVTISGSVAKLATHIYGKDENLCSTEKFYGQTTAEAFCSGSLVGPDLMLTAGHCITSQNECAKTKFVFGYSIKSAGEVPNTVDASDVYQCTKIIERNQEAKGADYALVQVDRKVKGHTPLAIKRTASKVGGKLQLIGHPLRLATKVADGSVRSVKDAGFIVTTVDSFGGNSGSPVFDAASGEIEGVLVRGDQDLSFDYKKDCNLYTVNPETGGRGEDVTRISAVAPAIDRFLSGAPAPNPSPSPSPSPIPSRPPRH